MTRRLSEEEIDANWREMMTRTKGLLQGQFLRPDDPNKDPSKNPVLDLLIKLEEGPDDQSFLKMNVDPAVNAPTKEFSFGLRRCPASKAGHHAFLGGLVAHMNEMWEVYKKLYPLLESFDQEQNHLQPWRVWAGILFHDLHKAVGNYKLVRQNWFEYFDYGDDLTNKMLNDDQKSALILSNANVYLDVIQANALYNSEGGWADNPPRFNTVLGKLLYLLDEASGNVLERLKQGGNAMLEKGATGSIPMLHVG